MITEDQVVEFFNMAFIRAVIPDGAPVIMVYQNPDDYPGKFVARLYDGNRSVHIVTLANTLEELRKAKPDRMVIIEKQKNDPSKTVETWL